MICQKHKLEPTESQYLVNILSMNKKRGYNTNPLITMYFLEFYINAWRTESYDALSAVHIFFSPQHVSRGLKNRLFSTAAGDRVRIE